MRNIWIAVMGLLCFIAGEARPQSFEQQLLGIQQQADTALQTLSNMQIPGVHAPDSKSVIDAGAGTVAGWVGGNYVNLRIAESAATGLVGGNYVNLRIAGSAVTGLVGSNYVNLRIAGSAVTGLVGSNYVNIGIAGSAITGWVGGNYVNLRIAGSAITGWGVNLNFSDVAITTNLALTISCII